MAHGPFDQIAGAFLDAPTAMRSGSASARRTLVLVGHMPMPAGLWLRQVADQVGRETGPVGLVRLEQDAVQLVVFRGAGLCPPIRSEASLQDALRAVGSAVSNWIVVPFSGHELEVPDGTSEALLVTSADEPAVLAAYTILKKFVAARGERGSRARLPGVSVEVLGATLEASAHAADSLAATAREFLSIDLPFRGSIHRIAPVEPSLQRTFDVQAPTLAQVYAMLAEAESQTGAPRAAMHAPLGARGDRFSARPDRVPPRRTTLALDAGPIPFTRPSTVTPAQVALPPRAVRGPAGTSSSGPMPLSRGSTGDSHAAGLRAALDAETRTDAAMASPAISSPGSSPLGTSGSAGPTSETSTSASSTAEASRSTISSLANPTSAASSPSLAVPSAAIPARGPAPEFRRAPVVREAPRAPAHEPHEASAVAATIAPSAETISTARETIRAASAALSAAAAESRAHSAAALPPVVAAPAEVRALGTELPAILATHVAGLAPLPFRAPREQGIELAVDAVGRMHVVGRASDSAAILRVCAWAREHAAILRLADARLTSEDAPALDVFVPDLREARAVQGATVHVLTLVEIAGRRGYLAQVAPD